MKVVILCGGKGTRSYPYTEYFPKPMMPICGKPILVHIMELYAQQGFTEFLLAAGHRKEILDDYFHDRFRDWQVHVLDTGQDSESGERIRRCQAYVGETFLVTYGDGIGDIRLNDLLAFHRAHGGLATVTGVRLRSQYGTIDFDNAGLVSRFREKPVIRDHWINAGFFVFERRAFDHWEGQNLETEILPRIVQRRSLYTYRHEGFWKSMDTTKDQQDLERIYVQGEAIWRLKTDSAVAAPVAVDGVSPSVILPKCGTSAGGYLRPEDELASPT